jgi:hypothetical protein
MAKGKRLYLNKVQIERAENARLKEYCFLKYKECPVAQCLLDNISCRDVSVFGDGEIWIDHEKKYKVCKLGVQRILNRFDQNFDVKPQHFMIYEI